MLSSRSQTDVTGTFPANPAPCRRSPRKCLTDLKGGKMTSGAKFRAGIPSRACGARDFHLKTDQPAILLPAQALRRVDVGTRCTATGRQFVEGAICDRKYRALACAEQAAPLSHGVRPSATTIPCVRQTPAQRGFHASPRGAREILIAWIVISSHPRMLLFGCTMASGTHTQHAQA
jgi:hypothetical protein